MAAVQPARACRRHEQRIVLANVMQWLSSRPSIVGEFVLMDYLVACTRSPEQSRRPIEVACATRRYLQQYLAVTLNCTARCSFSTLYSALALVAYGEEVVFRRCARSACRGTALRTAGS